MPVAYEGDVLISTMTFFILVYRQCLFYNIAKNPRSLAIGSTSSMVTSLEGRRFPQLSLPRRSRHDALATVGEQLVDDLDKRSKEHMRQGWIIHDPRRARCHWHF